MTEQRQTIDQQMSQNDRHTIQSIDIVIVSDLQISTNVESKKNVTLDEIEIVVEDGFDITETGAQWIRYTECRISIDVEEKETNDEKEIRDEISIEPLHGRLSNGWISDELYPEERMADSSDDGKIEERLDILSSLF